VLEAWGDPYFKKNGVFEVVVGRVEGENSTRILRIRGEDVSDLGLVIPDNFYDEDSYTPFFGQLERRLKKTLDAYLSGAPMPTQFVTNPRRPAAKKRPAAKRRNPSPRPSVKTLSHIVTPAEAKRLRDLMETSSVLSVLRAASRMMDGFDVEYIASSSDTMRRQDGLEYVNMGDTYDTTLIYDHGKGRFLVTSWGDIVERDHKRFGY
jgi:hypothetical protein